MRIRSVDRISFLPDEIICHILSFILIKYAVRTSCVSKRWQKLWTGITNLDFGDDILKTTGSSYIVCHVLDRCTSRQIHRFSLSANCFIWSDCFDKWVMNLNKRDIREFRLHVSVISHYIFTCKNLTDLDLESNVVLLDADDFPFELPNLKKLRTHLIYSSGDFSKKLFASCPALENLSIEGTVRSKVTFDISCPLLKTLKIHLDAWEFEGTKYEFVIKTPILQYLELIDMFKAEYIVDDLKSVIAAKLKMRDGAAAEISGSLPTELLWVFENLRILTVDADSLAVFDDPARPYLPMFEKMKRLEVSYYGQFDVAIMAPLMKACPQLEITQLEVTNHGLVNAIQKGIASQCDTGRICLDWKLKST